MNHFFKFARHTYLALSAFSLPWVVCWVDWIVTKRAIGDQWPDLKPLITNPVPAQIVHDFSGRLQFGIASGTLQIAGVALLIFAICVLSRLTGLKAAILTNAALVVIGLATYSIAWQDLNCSSSTSLDHVGMIRGVLKDILCSDVSNPFTSIDTTIGMNVLASAVGASALLLVFATVAYRRADNSVESLRIRVRDLQQAMLIGAIFFSIITAVNKILVDWPQSLLTTDEYQKAYASLAAAIGNYWGTLSALVLISALIPALVSLWLDIDRAVPPALEYKDRQAWKKHNDLDFGTRSRIGAAIATVAPILTIPGIDLATKLLS